jgi:ATP-dependent Lhr-like helicase
MRRLLGPTPRPDLPPALLADVAGTFRAKLQRTHPGYAPADAETMAECVEERLLLNAADWAALLAAWAGDQGPGADPAALVRALGPRVLALSPPGTPIRLLAAAETLPRLRAAWGCDLAALKPAALDPAHPAALPPPGRRRAPPAEWTLERPPQTPVPAGTDPRAAALHRALGDHLRTLGPVAENTLAALWGLDPDQAERAFSALAEAGTVIREALAPSVLAGDVPPIGPTPETGPTAEAVPALCDAEHYARLLRLARAARRPAFTALPLTALPSFLAAWHGLPARPTGIAGLQTALERLFGFAAPAAAWETDLLPARVAGYQPAWLDSLLSSSDLMWYGAGRERVGFCFTADLGRFTETAAIPAPAPARRTRPPRHPPARDRVAPAAAAVAPTTVPAPDPDADAAALLPDAEARYDFFALQRASGLTSSALTERLWRLTWAGLAVNDGMPALRQGLASGFTATTVAGIDSARMGIRGWQASRPLQGSWRRLAPDPAADGLARLDRDRDRVRALIARYGVLFRELLAHESPALGWGRLLPALRLMELAGELVTGQFFTGITGLQFTTPDGWRHLAREGPADAVWWCAAGDPASGCGLGLPGLAPLALPPRLAGTVLVWRGDAPALIARRGGRQLDIRLAYDHPGLPAAFAALADWLATGAVRALHVETINDEPATASAFALPLTRAGFQREPRALVLRRAY